MKNGHHENVATANQSTGDFTSNPRHLRLLKGLMSGPKFREETDRIAGASNSPHYIMELRCKFGLDIPCIPIPSIDRDGKPCRPGRYHLTDEDRLKVLVLLKEAA